MRMLHVFEVGLVGGSFRVVETLSIAQREAGLDPAVVAVADDSAAADHPLLESMRAAGVCVIPLILDHPRAYLQERRAVVETARRLRSDVVHTHGYRPDVVAATAARRAGVATVSTLHGVTAGGWRNRLYQWLQLRCVRRGDAVVAVSRPLRDGLLARGFPADRLHFVPNALPGDCHLLDRGDARAALDVALTGFRVGWVGRSSPDKAPDVMMKAIRLLGDDAPALSMVGVRAPESGAADALPQVTWHGPVHGADRLLRAFDLLVLSSRSEGTPMVLLEAMRAGVPVVATSVGGIPDVVTHAEALLVPPEDPRAIAEAIRAVVADPQAAARRARAARARFEREYDATSWVPRYQEVYRDALLRHGRPTGAPVPSGG